MSIEEYKNELVAEYKCSDAYGEMCDGYCKDCSSRAENDFNKLENLVRTDERRKFVEWFCEKLDNNGFVYASALLEDYEKEQKNED